MNLDFDRKRKTGMGFLFVMLFIKFFDSSLLNLSILSLLKLKNRPDGAILSQQQPWTFHGIPPC